MLSAAQQEQATSRQLAARLQTAELRYALLSTRLRSALVRQESRHLRQQPR
jgi:hypothetical protein